MPVFYPAFNDLVGPSEMSMIFTKAVSLQEDIMIHLKLL
jgi:hypothetical protein